MSFNWNEYFYHAQQLAQLTPGGAISDEAKKRVALSRAYYALLNQSKLWLLRKNNWSTVPSRPTRDAQPMRSHKAIRYWLRQQANSTLEDIADALEQLQKHRNNADYDLICDQLDKNQKLALISVETGLADLRKLN